MDLNRGTVVTLKAKYRVCEKELVRKWKEKIARDLGDNVKVNFKHINLAVVSKGAVKGAIVHNDVERTIQIRVEKCNKSAFVYYTEVLGCIERMILEHMQMSNTGNVYGATRDVYIPVDDGKVIDVCTVFADKVKRENREYVRNMMGTNRQQFVK